MSVAFLEEGTFQGGGGKESSSPKFWGGLLIKKRGLTDLGFFWKGVTRGEVNISVWGWYPGGNYGKVKLIHFSWVRLSF